LLFSAACTSIEAHERSSPEGHGLDPGAAMKRWKFAIVSIAAMLLSPAAFAKSTTVRIQVVATDLQTPLQISDPKILKAFSIWSSPGIDWSRGSVPAPRAAQRYSVTFHQSGREPMHEWHRRYFITYAIDSETNEGYVYLPGSADGEIFLRNAFSILRGTEGNWFHASRAWESSVRPLIERASIASPITLAR
jgi:hypothetical protein